MTFFEYIFGINTSQKEVPKRIFISFSAEDSRYRDFLVEQANHNRSPFYFHDYSVKTPWPQREWKKRCQTKIKGCCGMIVLLGADTHKSSGVLYEIQIAKVNRIPLICLRIRKRDKVVIPVGISSRNVYVWSWKNLELFLSNL